MDLLKKEQKLIALTNYLSKKPLEAHKDDDPYLQMQSLGSKIENSNEKARKTLEDRVHKLKMKHQSVSERKAVIDQVESEMQDSVLSDYIQKVKKVNKAAKLRR